MASSPSPDHRSGVALTGAIPVGDSSRHAFVYAKWFILTWRAIIIVASIVGIVLISRDQNGFAFQLVYFTIQSALFLILCAGYAAWAAVSGGPELSPVLMGAVVVYMVITGLVYNLILAKLPGPRHTAPNIIVPLVGGVLSSDLLHILVPLMALLDWILLTAHGRLRWRYALIWLSYPLAYFAFVLIRGLLVTGPARYPYSFLDVGQIGYGGVALNAVVYGIIFWLLGILLVALDRGLARLRRG